MVTINKMVQKVYIVELKVLDPLLLVLCVEHSSGSTHKICLVNEINSILLPIGVHKHLAGEAHI